MKLIIAGTRDCCDWRVVKAAFEASPFALQEITEVVSGRARGIDWSGEVWADKYGIDVTCFAADWKRHGKKAGPIRNQEMADYCGPGDGLLAIPGPGSRGTWDMVRRAEARGLAVYVYRGLLNDS